MKLKYTILTALTCAALLGSAALSPAALTIGNIISVNLSVGGVTPSGAAVIGQVGDIWTQVTQGGSFGTAVTTTPYALNTTTGASSGVSMAFAGNGKSHGTANAGNLDVFEQGFYLDTGVTSATITFSGFTPGTIVNLYLLGGGYNTNEEAQFTFNSITKTMVGSADIETTYRLNDNYVMFSDLVANGSGNISGTWTKPSGNTFSIFNGAQIAVIPEPSAVLLGGLGLLALLRRRR